MTSIVHLLYIQRHTHTQQHKAVSTSSTRGATLPPSCAALTMMRRVLTAMLQRGRCGQHAVEWLTELQGWRVFMSRCVVCFLGCVFGCVFGVPLCVDDMFEPSTPLPPPQATQHHAYRTTSRRHYVRHTNSPPRHTTPAHTPTHTPTHQPPRSTTAAPVCVYT